MIERIQTQRRMDEVESWIQLSHVVSRKALLIKYPQLENFKDLLIDKIHVGSPQQIMELERKDRPRTSFYLYDEYLKMGVPEKVLDGYYYRTDLNSPFYPDYQNSQIWLSTHFLSRFSSNNFVERLDASVFLGDTLIEQNLKVLAFRLYPYDFGPIDDFFLRLMMKQGMKPFLDEVANQLKGKDQRRTFRAVSKEWMSDLFSPEGFRARQAECMGVGAQFFCLFSNQSVLKAEFIIGDDFDNGTIEYLSQPAKELFRQLLTEAWEIEIIFDPLIASSQQQQAEKILAILDPDFDRDYVLRKYIHSTLAKSYLQSDDPRLDPFNYGQLAD